NLDPIDEARSRTVEIRRAVNGVHLSFPAWQYVRTPVFLDCSIERKAAWHEHNDFRLGAQDLLKSNSFRFSARRADHFMPDGDTTHSGNPVSAEKGGIEPLHRINSRPRQTGHSFTDTCQPAS